MKSKNTDNNYVINRNNTLNAYQQFEQNQIDKAVQKSNTIKNKNENNENNESNKNNENADQNQESIQDSENTDRKSTRLNSSHL